MSSSLPWQSSKDNSEANGAKVYLEYIKVAGGSAKGNRAVYVPRTAMSLTKVLDREGRGVLTEPKFDEIHSNRAG